jgi:hypothetical protein
VSAGCGFPLWRSRRFNEVFAVSPQKALYGVEELGMAAFAAEYPVLEDGQQRTNDWRRLLFHSGQIAPQTAAGCGSLVGAALAAFLHFLIVCCATSRHLSNAIIAMLR